MGGGRDEMDITDALQVFDDLRTAFKKGLAQSIGAAITHDQSQKRRASSTLSGTPAALFRALPGTHFVPPEVDRMPPTAAVFSHSKTLKPS
jgi:hypothetical protein